MLSSTAEQPLRRSFSEHRLHTSDGLPVAGPSTRKPTRKSSFRALAAAWNSDHPTRSGVASTGQTPISAKYPSPSISSPTSSLVSPVTPWLSPDALSSSKPASAIRQIHAPTTGLAFAPSKAHSRSGSSSGYETATTNTRSLSHYTDHSHTLKSQYEMKRMMSKPAATSKDYRTRPQTAIDGPSMTQLRRTASSDLGQPSHTTSPLQPSRQVPQNIHNSFLSFSPVDDNGPTSRVFWGSLASAPTTPASAPPQCLEVKRKRSLLRKSPRLPATEQSPHFPKDPSSSSTSHSPGPGLSPKVLTPAASLVEEYKESERRRAKLAQAASGAFTQNDNPSIVKPKPDHVSIAGQFNPPLNRGVSMPYFEARRPVPAYDDDPPFSDYMPLTWSRPSTASNTVHSRKSLDKPTLRINTNSPDQLDELGIHQPRRAAASIDYGNHRKTVPTEELNITESDRGKRMPPRSADTPCTDEPSPQGSRIWKLVKRLSTGILREKSLHEPGKLDAVPPVPAIPENLRHTSKANRHSSVSPKTNQQLDGRSPLAVNVALPSQTTKNRSYTTVASSGISDPAHSGLSVQHPASNRSSASSYGVEIIPPARGREYPQPNVPPSGLTPPRFDSFTTTHWKGGFIPKSTNQFPSRNGSDSDFPPSPLIPTFSTATIFNRFDELDSKSNKISVQGSSPTLSDALVGQADSRSKQHKIRDKDNISRPTALLCSRKSTDGSRRPEPKGRVDIEFDSDHRERRRTRSLDRLLSERAVTFRALGDPHSPLTEEQKSRRWEELLWRSDLAGGTISVSTGPKIS